MPYNGQVNFAGNEVKMKFTEYIRLNNPSENIIIIPQLENQPDIEAKNKKLTITFNEELEENTTYTITFNGAIQDITEKNDSVFQFVFSTGDYIDSLSVTGQVKDAFTNKPLKEILIGLYPKTLEANFDSIPLKYKPTYLGQSDQAGTFQLNYLKSGVYYLFAIEDRNRNLLYDKGEGFALLAEKEFKLGPDETPDFDLRSFKETSKEIYLEDLNFTFPGRVEVILSNPTDSFSISSNLPLLQEETGQRDSLIFWLEKSPVPKMKFYVELKGEKDTIRPVYKKIPDDIETVKLTQKNNIKKGKLLPQENLQFTFSEPLLDIDLNAVHFYDLDSQEVKIDSFQMNLRTLEFNTAGSDAHRIVIDSAALVSFYGRVLDKELSFTFENEPADYYGSLIVTMDTTFSMPVIVHLLDNNGDAIDTVDFNQKMIFSELIPGNYQLRLIFDVDKNGEWTTGSLADGREPEKVIYNKETIKVKSKWEKEFDWVLTPK
ncbi:MAG: Ig-like domain-containing protein [Crocinitomicaceae bacterium]|nr:Ig-like domain-containing protein [Crocinitomicaceae bacterium]